LSLLVIIVLYFVIIVAVLITAIFMLCYHLLSIRFSIFHLSLLCLLLVLVSSLYL